MTKIPNLVKVTLALSAVCLVASLFCPAFYIDRKDFDAYADSRFLFFLGWMSFLGGGLVPFLIWLANPIYIVAFFSLPTLKKQSFVLSVLAACIALSFSQLDTILTSENGAYSAITSVELGYKLWVASMVILVVGSGVNLFQDRQSRLAEGRSGLEDSTPRVTGVS